MGKTSKRVRNKTKTQPATKSANNFETLGTLPAAQFAPQAGATQSATQPMNSFPDGTETDDQYTLHKQAFDRVIAKYQLDAPDKADAIVEMLTAQTGQEEGLTAPFFAEKFGTDVEEAVVFLEWIKLGLKFKEEAIDTAKKAGLSKT